MTEKTTLVPEQIKLLKTEKLLLKLAGAIAALGGYAKAADDKLGVTTATDLHPGLVEATANLALKLNEFHQKVELEAINAQAIFLASGGDCKDCDPPALKVLGLS